MKKVEDETIAAAAILCFGIAALLAFLPACAFDQQLLGGTISGTVEYQEPDRLHATAQADYELGKLACMVPYADLVFDCPEEGAAD